MSTLNVDLDKRIKASPRFNADTLAEYFQGSGLRWWKPTSSPYKEQETAIGGWLASVDLGHALELGAGFGRISGLLAKGLPDTLTLVDINTRAVKSLCKRFPDAEVHRTALEEFNYPRAPYDFVASVEVMVHIQDLPALTRKVHDNLRHGGYWLTSLTPDTWYRDNGIKRTVIHRGISPEEFERMTARSFDVNEMHKSDNGQLVTYLLQAK